MHELLYVASSAWLLAKNVLSWWHGKVSAIDCLCILKFRLHVLPHCVFCNEAKSCATEKRTQTECWGDVYGIAINSDCRSVECFTLVETSTLLETCTKRGPLLGLNLFISHDRPPRNTCWGLFYSTCEFLDQLCISKGSRRDFLHSISGRVHILTRVKHPMVFF